MADDDNTSERRGMPGNGGSRPVPDPTVLTTQALEREGINLRESLQEFKDTLNKRHDSDRQLLESELETLRERLRGIDEATRLRYEIIGHIPAQMDEKVSHLESLTDEKFKAIATQFSERDTRSERESRDNKVAVDAAFAAQKEAAAKQEETFSKGIDKSEAATKETINKLAELFTTTNAGLADKIEDLKDRVGRVESVKIGASEAKSSFGSNIGILVGVGSLLLIAITVVGFIVANSP